MVCLVSTALFLDFSNGTAVSQSPFNEEEENTALAANQTEDVANTVRRINKVKALVIKKSRLVRLQ